MSNNKDAIFDLSIDEAVARDIAQFAGNESELSVRVCGSKQALSHKKAGFRGSYFSVQEVAEIQLHSGSRHAMHAMARLLGGVFLDLPSCEVDMPEDRNALMGRMAAVSIRLGRLFDRMDMAQEDGVIDALERSDILKMEQEVRTGMAEWIQLSFMLHPEKEQDDEAEST